MVRDGKSAVLLPAQSRRTVEIWHRIAVRFRRCLHFAYYNTYVSHFAAYLRRYTPSEVDAYRRETKSLVTRFVKNQLPFESCIYSLDAALLRLISRMRPKQLNELRSVMLGNNELVMEEMARRGKVGDC
jgi:hypothetical protein